MEGPKAAQSNRGVNQNKRPNSVEGALWRHDQILGGQMVRGDRTLMDKFPTLYQVSNQQQQTISLMGSHKEEGWEWNFNWRRNLFDSEASMAAEFIEETGLISV